MSRGLGPTRIQCTACETKQGYLAGGYLVRCQSLMNKNGILQPIYNITISVDKCTFLFSLFPKSKSLACIHTIQ